MYYKLKQTPVMEGLYRTVAPRLGPKVRWLSGQALTMPIPTPLVVQLADDYGTELADYLDDNVPLMTNEMVKAMRAAGVDNFNAYDAILVDERREKKFAGYQAIQVIGRVAAADIAASDAVDPLKVGHSVVQFRKLVLDGSRVKHLLFFRLHESPSTLLIHERVKVALDKLPLRFVSFVPVDKQAVPELDTDDGDEE